MAFSGYALPCPTDWQAFERLCRDLWAEIWADRNAQLHGRLGQPQCGVDVFGQVGGNGGWAGVQCKERDGYPDRALLTRAELRNEVEKAKRFDRKLSEFVLATTAKRDQKVQEWAREITEENQAANLFRVSVWSWDDIIEELGQPKHTEAFLKHFGQLVETVREMGRSSSERLDLQEFCRRYREARFHELDPLVPLRVDGNDSSLLVAIELAIKQPSCIQVVGPSGGGKSHACLHVMRRLLDANVPAIICQARHFNGRALEWQDTSPALYGTSFHQLAAEARREGVPLVVLVDGANECPEEHGPGFREVLVAMAQRLPEIVLIVTSQRELPFPSTVRLKNLRVASSSLEEREAVLRAHGVVDPSQLHREELSVLRTPQDAAMAAQIWADLPNNLNRFKLRHAFVLKALRRKNAERASSLLRKLAFEMAVASRQAMSAAECHRIAARTSVDGSEVDLMSSVASGLLVQGSGQYAFAHESLWAFLVADELLVQNRDVAELARALDGIPSGEIARLAIQGLEDESSVRGLLYASRSIKALWMEADRGELGLLAQRTLEREISENLNCGKVLDGCNAEEVLKGNAKQVTAPTSPALATVIGYLATEAPPEKWLGRCLAFLSEVDEYLEYIGESAQSLEDKWCLPCRICSNAYSSDPEGPEGFVPAYFTYFERSTTPARAIPWPRDAALAVARHLRTAYDLSYGALTFLTRLARCCLQEGGHLPGLGGILPGVLYDAAEAHGNEPKANSLELCEVAMRVYGCNRRLKLKLLDTLTREHFSCCSDDMTREHAVRVRKKVHASLEHCCSHARLAMAVRAVLAEPDFELGRSAAYELLSNQFVSLLELDPTRGAILRSLAGEELERFLALAVLGADDDFVRLPGLILMLGANATRVTSDLTRRALLKWAQPPSVGAIWGEERRPTDAFITAHAVMGRLRLDPPEVSGSPEESRTWMNLGRLIQIAHQNESNVGKSREAEAIWNALMVDLPSQGVEAVRWLTRYSPRLSIFGGRSLVNIGEIWPDEVCRFAFRWAMERQDPGSVDDSLELIWQFGGPSERQSVLGLRERYPDQKGWIDHVVRDAAQEKELLGRQAMR